MSTARLGGDVNSYYIRYFWIFIMYVDFLYTHLLYNLINLLIYRNSCPKHRKYLYSPRPKTQRNSRSQSPSTPLSKPTKI